MIEKGRSFSYSFHLIIFLILAVEIYFLRYNLPIDHLVSDLFFKNGEWLWPKQNETLTFWLHDFIKYIFIVIGVGCLVACIASKFISKLKPYRYLALLVASSLTITPAIIAQLKAETHIFCPSKLERYEGNFPDNYRQLHLTNDELKQARCFPAAHASPGFALLVLGTSAFTRRRKLIGYGIGAIAGTALSIIQIGRGEHFLTHCVASALIALWIAYGLTCMARFSHKRGWI